MMKKKTFLVLLAALLLFTACAEKEKTAEPETETQDTTEETQEAAGPAGNVPEGEVDIEAYLHTRGEETEPEKPTLPPFLFSEDARWIWDTSNENDTWMCLRKEVSLSEEEAASVTAHISVDSKYWLFVNGEPVVKEGGLKRGQSPDSTYYDTVDLTGKFVSGENTIAVLAWYFGPSNAFGYRSSKKAAFLMQLDCGKRTICSDDTWKVKKSPAFLHDDESNYRLPESDVCYHAAYDEPWKEADFDDASWETAEVRGRAGDAPWGTLVERPVPLFVFEEPKEFENPESCRDLYTTEETTVTMTLPANIQFVPVLSLVGDPGEHVVRVWTDTRQDNNGDSVMLKYVTKEGEQEFESPAWLSGEKVYFKLDAGIRVRSLRYCETHYDSAFAGSFTCSDGFYDRLWKKAQRTLYVCMRDSFMDCPNRERAQWFADAALDMEIAACSMDPEAMKLYANAVRTTILSPRGEALSNMEPCGEEQTIIPSQILMGFSALYDYYLYTGDRAFVREIYEPVRDYLLGWKIRKKGLVEYPYGEFWQWGDSTSWSDYPLLLSAWYRMDMQVMDRLAEVLGEEADREEYKSRADQIAAGFRENFRSEDGLFVSADAPYPDERVQALAVLTGIFEEGEYTPVRALFSEPFENGKSSYPLLEYYVEKACFAMGNPTMALNRMEERYREMVEGEHAMSTLWEYWVYHQGTENHAWSGGPLVLLSQHLAGVRPLTAEYETFAVEPGICDRISSFEAAIPTKYGEILVRYHAEGEEKLLEVTEPPGTKAEVKVPEEVRVTVNAG